jgi:hypothetical protein
LLGEVALGERGRLCPVSNVELDEDVANVGGDGLRADEQAGGDLGVGQSIAQVAKDFNLPPGKLPEQLRSGSAPDPQVSEEPGRTVGVARGPQALERIESLPSLFNGALRKNRATRMAAGSSS